MYRKYAGIIIPIIMLILIQSSCRVLNVMSPACRPNFAKLPAPHKRLTGPELEFAVMRNSASFLNMQAG